MILMNEKGNTAIKEILFAFNFMAGFIITLR